MNTEEIRQLIKQQLPIQIKEDPELQDLILKLSRNAFAPRQQTEDRFDQILAELRSDRQTQNKKWEEQNRKWREHQDKQDQKWEEQNQKWQEHQDKQDLKWKEQNQKWQEHQDKQDLKWREHQDKQDQKWQEQQDKQDLKWQEQQDKQDQKWREYQDKQDLKWEENQKELKNIHEEIMALSKKLDRSIGGLGARWGIKSEASFRNALAGILEESFGVQVLHVDEYDDEGQVFGRPDQVELDVIIKNGLLILCELKSSIDKAGMYIFERKVRFYEEKHQRKATRFMVISPMIDPRAIKVAQALGIETYSDSIDVDPE